MKNFQVIVESQDSQFVTYVPALDFASTFGPTREIALARTGEMITGYLEAARIEGLEIPSSEGRHAELVDVAIA